MIRAWIKKRRFFSLLILWSVLAVFAASCGTKSNLSPEEEVLIKGTTFSFDKKAYPSDQNLFPAYKLVPGDILDVLFQVRSWEKKDEFRIAIDHTITVKFIHAPSLNETQNVKPDGKITLPYIGEMMVAGMTVKEVTDELKNRYKGILREPVDLYVTVPEYSTQIKDFKNDLHTAPRGLSRLVTVRPDGFCTFPIAGDVYVATRTIPEVKVILDKRYDAFLPGLNVDLFLEKHSGATVYVLGQVAQPGAYKMPKPINVIQAITLAGGTRPGADLKKTLVFRLCKNDRVATQVDVEATLLVEDKSAFFYVYPDDIVYVPPSRSYQIAEIMSEINQILMFRGWGFSFGNSLYRDPILE
ncbi:MAG: polysaccharide biosynthesis/export family protein [Proteobacteria bacterium]|nr:polysaccharide biosynthesis/export family protein [Pseudomonadota bacterium]